MAKAKQQSTQKKSAKNDIDMDLMHQPWIRMRTGLIIMGLMSVVMAVLTAKEAIPIKGFWPGIAWGLMFGIGIWVIFFAGILINRFFRRF